MADAPQLTIEHAFNLTVPVLFDGEPQDLYLTRHGKWWDVTVPRRPRHEDGEQYTVWRKLTRLNLGGGWTEGISLPDAQLFEDPQEALAAAWSTPEITSPATPDQTDA